MVEVFKTNVQEKNEAQEIINLLMSKFPGSKINFDLHDCDRILRIESRHVSAREVVDLVLQNGFHCDILD